MKFNMEASNLYTDTLRQLLSNKTISMIDDRIRVNLYVTLLSLNDNKYTLLNIMEESKEIKLLLTKLNNLKVKIQLKRKQKEIDDLAEDIKRIYDVKRKLLLNYIDDREELFRIIDTRDAKEITKYIDKVTKVEIVKTDRMDERNDLREKVLDLILKNVYQVNDQTICISGCQEKVKILINDFFDIFNYLLNIDNYDNIYKLNSSNDSHREIINDIIKVIRLEDCNCESLKKIVIPMILTYMLPSLDETIKTADFVIENIKISDLYSMAKNNSQNKDTARWKNVQISNEYLFKKIAEMVNRGMYYYQDNKFILELVDNKISDFKVSIEIDKMISFLNDNLKTCVLEV